MAKYPVSITMKGEIVDDGNGFYYRVKPNVNTGKARLDDRDRRLIVEDVRKAVQKKFKRIKL